MYDKISVIMSVYKETEKELKQSIDSILNQTIENFEFIIVIDYPLEKWRIDYIKGYSDDRIKIVINDENIGLPKSLNKALDLATGEYIARMDADDIAFPNRFEKQLEFLKETGYDMCGANIKCFNDENDLIDARYPKEATNVKKLLFLKNCVPHPAYFAKSEVYKKLDGYSNIFSCEDYDFILRAVNAGFLIGNVQEILLKYRINLKSISRKNAGMQEIIAEYLRKFYKKNKNEIVTEEMIDSYINSKKYSKKIKSYNFYCNMKNTRSRYKNNKGPKYYFYTMLLILNFRHSLKDIYTRIYERLLLRKEVK